MITLRDGTGVQDKRLDRLQEFDERSRQFNIADEGIVESLKTKTWQCPTYLDQGNEGACVGFSFSQSAAAYTNHTKGITNQFANERD
jgi:hypothetical protein